MFSAIGQKIDFIWSEVKNDAQTIRHSQEGLFSKVNAVALAKISGATLMAASVAFGVTFTLLSLSGGSLFGAIFYTAFSVACYALAHDLFTLAYNKQHPLTKQAIIATNIVTDQISWAVDGLKRALGVANANGNNQISIEASTKLAKVKASTRNTILEPIWNEILMRII